MIFIYSTFNTLCTNECKYSVLILSLHLYALVHIKNVYTNKVCLLDTFCLMYIAVDIF